MKDIIIKKLTSELKDDYLEFFDFRAFSDGNIQKAVIVFGIIGRNCMNMSVV